MNHEADKVIEVYNWGVKIPHHLKDIKRIKRKLTTRVVGFNGAVTTRQTFWTDRENGCVWAARSRAVELLEKGYRIKTHFDRGQRIDTGHVMLKLYDYQQTISDWLKANVFNKRAARCGVSTTILELQAGRGKTFISMDIIAHIGRKTLVVVPDINLVRQWRDALTVTFPDVTAGEWYGKVKQVGDITVGTITSVAMQPMEWFEQFGFTIYDEIDQYCTAKRATVFRGMSRYALGMSATCFERLDGLDTIAHNHVGAPISAERILTIQDTCDKPNGAGKQWKFKAWAVRYNGPDCYTRSVLSQQGTVSHPMMVSQFSCDPYRNQLIVDETVRLYRAGHSVFVFLDRVTLIKQLAEETRRVLGLCTEERTDVSELIGEKNEDERRDAEGAKICFLSYKCGGVGLSWPRFSAAVFAHPRRNRYKQFLNRIFRENGDETITREAVYIVDNSTSLKGQYSGFRKTCREERDVTPETRTVDYHEILPSEQIKTLSLQLKEN